MTHLSIPSFWRLNKARYLMVGSKCSLCGTVSFPPRDFCKTCGGKTTEVRLPDSGKILTWTTIHVAPDGFETPYTIGIVQLDNGVVVSGCIVGDMRKLDFGAQVKAVFRKNKETRDRLLLYTLKFELQ